MNNPLSAASQQEVRSSTISKARLFASSSTHNQNEQPTSTTNTKLPQHSAQLSIGEVAERLGLSVHSLRFYEREGLMLTLKVSRDGGGRRRYNEVDVEWLRICICLRASGMPIAQIRRFAELVRLGPGNEHERLAILKEHQQRVIDQMQHLNECLDVITNKANVYENYISSSLDRA
ncbi:MerR family transcriptional regulator [Paenibacillus campi]|uniref:MerR family transcriptional regulator n=1 Tax=Paenibacillus campi TaxID=3106031 RepID=UPI002AFE9E9C|nr:MerR family transcriptional regulator [Paenibacillus sp. SGZ-1014]